MTATRFNLADGGLKPTLQVAVRSVRLDSSNDVYGWTLPPTEVTTVLYPDRLERDGDVERRFDDPLEALQWLDEERTRDEDACWVGFLGYEIGRRFEPAAKHREERDTKTPLFWFAKVAVGRASARRSPDVVLKHDQREITSSFRRDEYLAAVQRCSEYIAAGDAYQVNLSQRLTISNPTAADIIYDHLLRETPATFGALLDLGDVTVISNSPELFLHVTPTGMVTTKPIKGTRPTSETAASLFESEKDAAELNMIVDLERNDLGRVCETGSVRVSMPRTIETHPTVHHGVATVTGQLRDDVGLIGLLAATFPSGSVTGAPKIRAMQIIDELEPVARGPYCGAIGRLDADGSMLFNVAIRTATWTAEALHIPVGGGIVADSDPVAEFDETLVKARALLKAAGVEQVALHDR